jgi:hypothetical protein
MGHYVPVHNKRRKMNNRKNVEEGEMREALESSRSLLWLADEED